MADNLRKKTFWGILWSLAEKFALEIFGLFQGIILARLLMPSDYGLIGMVAIFLGISYTLADAGFCSALVRKKDRTAIDYSTVYTVNVCVSLFFCVILCLSSSLIADFYNQPMLRNIVCVNAIYLFLQSFLAVQNARLSILLKFKNRGIISVCTEVTTGIFSIIMALAGFGVWSLVVPCYFGLVVKAIMFWKLEHWFPGFGFSKKSFKEFWGFGSKLLVTNLINNIYGNIYPMVIGKVYSPSDLGLYSKASGYAKLPSGIINGVVSKVSFPVLSEIQDDDKRLAEVYRRMIKVSTYIVFPLLVGLSALARPFIIVLITNKWAASIILLQVLCFSTMWSPIHSLNLNLLQIKGRSDLFLRLEIIKKILGIIVLVTTVPLGLYYMCIGSVISSLICLFINTFYTGKLIKVGLLVQIKDTLPSLLYSLSMGLLIWFCISYIQSNWLQLIIGTSIGIAYYISISLVTKSPELKYLVFLIKEDMKIPFKFRH